MDNLDRLRALIADDYAGNQAAFARAVGRQPAQINQYLLKRRTLGLEFMLAVNGILKRKVFDLSDVPGFYKGSLYHLTLEHGPMPTAPPPSEHGTEQQLAPYRVTGSPSDQAAPPGAAAIQVPTLANAGSMGAGNDVLHDDVMVGALALSADWVYKRIRPTSPGALRCMHAYGDSMSPTFEDGDILLVDTGATNVSDADGVYVLEANQRLFIKRVTERLGGGHDVTSDNPRVKTVSDLNGNHEVSVKGRVVWSWNGKKL